MSVFASEASILEAIENFRLTALEYEAELNSGGGTENYLGNLVSGFVRNILEKKPISQHMWRLMMCMQEIYDEDYEFKIQFGRYEDVLEEERGDVLERACYYLDQKHDSMYSEILDEMYDRITEGYSPDTEEWALLIEGFEHTNLKTEKDIADYLGFKHEE